MLSIFGHSFVLERLPWGGDPFHRQPESLHRSATLSLFDFCVPQLCTLETFNAAEPSDKNECTTLSISDRDGLAFGFASTGLQNVHDRLLKWVAEYTKSVPWAYVYFEGVDTTWNLPENTDRIFFHSEVGGGRWRTPVC